MGWLQRLCGADESAARAAPSSCEPCLVAAGWRPDRVSDFSAAEQALQESGFRLHEVGRRFLSEYYGLAIDVPIIGGDEIKGFVHFSPEKAIRLLAPADLPRLSDLLPKGACPVGTTGGHTMFIFMDEEGRSYLLDMEWTLFAELADSPAGTVMVLCDGRNGRVDSQVLDEHGRRTGHVIRDGEERRWWQLDQFPNLAGFLPRVSLSPCRRPPTWRAMVRAAEDTLAQGGSPSKVMITCGGFFNLPSGQAFFVAHCENCLYVRAKAGFQVLPPPPSVAPGFRVGEVVPFKPPSGW